LNGGYEAQHSREAELNVGGSVGGSVGQQVGQNSEVDVWSTPQHDPLSPYSNHHHHQQHAAYYAQVGLAHSSRCYHARVISASQIWTGFLL